MKRLIISGSPRARGRSAGVAEAVRFAFEESVYSPFAPSAGAMWQSEQP